MDVNKHVEYLKKIKPSLVFFCLVTLFIGCKQQPPGDKITVRDVEQKVSEISVTAQDITGVQVFLKGETATGVLGKWTSVGNRHQFVPAAPFTPGQTYDLRKDGRLLDTFKIEVAFDEMPPEILMLYPTRDTVPENLLKIYLRFSQPMQEVGSALDFISVYNETQEREETIFLELQSELWNRKHNRLTLWLDPGRIKTDLIPNKEKGLPILKGNTYTLSISDAWRSAKGQKLSGPYIKKWVVTKRDDQKPDVSIWKIRVPKVNTIDPLHLEFGEPMDAILAMETIGISDLSGNAVPGNLALTANELGILFHPTRIWEKGIYALHIQSKLEDLAGNNLNRLFDTPVSKSSAEDSTVLGKELSFTIR